MLAEQSRMGKVHMVESMKDRTLHSLMAIKKTPNGRVNFTTVDQNARLMANSISEMFNLHLNDDEFKEE